MVMETRHLQGREAVEWLVKAGAVRDLDRPECLRESSLPPIAPGGPVQGIAYRADAGLICPENLAVLAEPVADRPVPPTISEEPWEEDTDPLQPVGVIKVPEVGEGPATGEHQASQEQIAAVSRISHMFEAHIPPARLGNLWQSDVASYPDVAFEERYLSSRGEEDFLVPYIHGFVEQREGEKPEIVIRRCSAMEGTVENEVIFAASNPLFGPVTGRGMLEAVAAYYTRRIRDDSIADGDPSSAVESVALILVEQIKAKVGEEAVLRAFFGDGMAALATLRERLNSTCGAPAFDLIKELTDHEYADYELAIRVVQGTYPIKALSGHEDSQPDSPALERAEIPTAPGPVAIPEGGETESQTQLEKAVRVVLRFSIDSLLDGLPEAQATWVRSAYERVILPQRLRRADQDSAMVRRFRSMVVSQVIREGVGALPPERRWPRMVGHYYEARLAPLSTSAFNAAKEVQRQGGQEAKAQEVAERVLDGVTKIVEGVARQEPHTPAVFRRALSDTILDCYYASSRSPLMSLRLNRHLALKTRREERSST